VNSGGWAALVGVAVFAVVVIALHVLQREYDPATQLMSELALGRFGGAMLAAFAGLAMAMFAVQLSIGRLGAGKILRALMAAAAAFFLVAGLFPLGETATIHIAAIALAFVLSVLAMYLFPATAGAASRLAPRKVSWTLAAGMAASVALGRLAPMGLAQRAAAICLLAWLVIVGWRLAHYRPGQEGENAMKGRAQ
jgi:hypothetical membrane protein